MQLNQACTKFVNGYFSTNDRAEKTRAAYLSDLAQFNVFAGEDLPLKSVSGALIERWSAHLRQLRYSPASISRKSSVARIISAASCCYS
jgi:site-specific recombinase XerD